MPIAFTGLLYLTETARSVRLDDNEVKSQKSPRSFVKWSREEGQLLRALREAGFPLVRIAELLERTEKALDFREAGAAKLKFGDLPQSCVSLTNADLALLQRWEQPPIRDALGWQFGRPFELAKHLQDEPSLVVVNVKLDSSTVWPQRAGSREEDGTANDWPVLLQDLDNMTQAVWMDIAASVTAAGGLVVNAGAPMNSARHTALRQGLKRTRGVPPPRRSVRQTQENLGDRQVALLSRDVSAIDLIQLRDIQTLILVQPDLPRVAVAAPQCAPFPVDLPFMLQAASDDPLWPKQISFLQRQQTGSAEHLSKGRQLIRIGVSGLPNSHGSLARLDWNVLQHVPDGSIIHAAREDLLVRAATWLTLSSGRTAQLPEHLTAQLPFSPDTVPADRASEQFHQWCRESGKTPQEQVYLRCWLDVQYMSAPARRSGIRFVIDPDMTMTYIGR